MPSIQSAHFPRLAAKLAPARLLRGAHLSVLLVCAALPTAAAAQTGLQFTTTPPTSVAAGTLYTYTFQATLTGDSDGDGPIDALIVYGAPQLPAWLTFDAAQRTISGTPNAAQVGAHPVTLTATVGLITETQSFDIAVAAPPNRPPVASPIAPSPQDAFVGDPYQLDVRPFFSDPDGDALSFAASGLPAGLAIRNGSISGTPTDASGSPFTVNVSASDGEAQASSSFTLRVTQRNRPPRLARSITPDPQTATVGSSYTLSAGSFFEDPDGDALAFTATGLPAGFSIDSADGTIRGAPTEADAATSPYTVTVQAADAEGAASDAFTLQVVRPDRPPQRDEPLTPDPQTAAEGQPYSFAAGGFFSDPDGDPLQFSATGLPPSLSIDGGTGTISGTPRNADVAGSPYRVTVRAANDGGAATGQFTLRIDNLNEPPVIPEPVPRLGTPEDTPLQITAELLRATDPDPNDELRVRLASPPDGAPYSVSGARVVPAEDFNGSFTVGAEVSDGELDSNTVQVTVDVDARNDAPRGGPVPAQTATENSPFELALAPLFSDPEDDPLSFSATGLPPGLMLDAVTGRLAGTPPVGTQARDYRVNLTVSDNDENLRTSFTIALLAAGRADLAVEVAAAPNPATIGSDATWTFTVHNRAAGVDVGNADLHVDFSGDVPATFATPGNPSCTLSASTPPAALDCRIGPIAGDANAAVTLIATGSRAGDLSAEASVAIADPVPLDADATNDTARGALQITEGVSSAAQTVTLADARGVAAGDLDGDGAGDLAVATGGGFVILPATVDPGNAAKRVLGAAITVGPAAPANAVAVADLDGDADLDAAVAYDAGAPDTVWLNDGSLGFLPVPLGGEGMASRTIAITDFDGDGLLDVAAAGDGAAAVYGNGGGATFARRVALSVGAARGIAIVDLLGDAVPEIVVANADGDTAVYAGAGETWQLAATLQTGPAASVTAADFDGDGVNDLAFARPDGRGNPVLLNRSGAEPLFFPAAALGATETLAVLAADVDFDGDADILAVNASGSHQIYENGNEASAVFLLHPEQLAASGAAAGSVGKVSVDDRLDVVLAGGAGVDVFYNDGAGNLGRGDEGAPTVSIVGEPQVTVTVGDAYSDAGATATDAVDGDLTSRITTTNPVDTAVVGTYTITYNVVDTSGNAAAPATRSVEVRARDDAGGGGGGAAGAGLVVCLLYAAFRKKKRRTT